ncbi:hypothetical protein Q8A73_000111 [Channa argus]|nr:hypothetical protein Q8A73_000111 [Channa argus]
MQQWHLWSQRQKYKRGRLQGRNCSRRKRRGPALPFTPAPYPREGTQIQAPMMKITVNSTRRRCRSEDRNIRTITIFGEMITHGTSPPHSTPKTQGGYYLIYTPLLSGVLIQCTEVTVLQRMAQDHVEVGSNILVVIRVNPYPGRQLQGQGPPIRGRGASCGRGTHMAPTPAVAPSGQF